jgi:restriction system protein
MAIPDFQTLMLPLLTFASDQKEHSLRQAIDALAEQFKLSDAERKELFPSGQQATFDNRVGWTRTHLSKAGLIESTRRGFFRIADRGLDAIKSSPSHINMKFLEQYPEYIEFRTRKNKSDGPEELPELTAAQTPEETIESAYQFLGNQLAADLLQRIKQCSPAFFERLVVDLLVKMGYGGTRKDAGQAVGRSGDGGIDGIIKEDRLGLDVIYIQAKRWEGTVGRPEIQKFVGALQGLKARKGVFITTSSFTKEAEQYSSMIQNTVVLIDGETMAKLMIDNNVGVSLMASYEIKRADTDYFTEE